MGTRADFYVGRDDAAEWLGSIAYDGYPGEGIPSPLLGLATEEDFRVAVEKILTSDHATRPEQGWPWPWDNSGTTDYAYAFDSVEQAVYVSSFGGVWVHARNLGTDGEPTFPDMTDRKNVTLGARSGLLVIRA